MPFLILIIAGAHGATRFPILGCPLSVQANSDATKVSLLRLDENASKFIGNAVFGLMIHAMRDPELGMSVIADPFISASFLSFLDI